jgi:predicted ArsR family transcriptional regulator
VDADLSPARRRVIELLKRRPGRTAADVAGDLGLTVAAIRLHLQALAEQGLAKATTRAPVGRGRPATTWSLTALADGLFPDRHADLTVSLLHSLREALGDDGIQRVIDAREAEQTAAYRTRVGSGSLRRRVEALARVRTDEGYMAEVADGGDGSFLLIENHCPICEAAASCQALCRSELDVFQAALGDDVAVAREQHLLSGDDRCVYRISRAGRGFAHEQTA